MPGVKTALQLVTEARYHAQEMSVGTYRDGFTGDVGTSGGAPSATAIPILYFVNQAIGIFAHSGFCTNNFTVPLVVGQLEYALPSLNIGKIIWARVTMGSYDTDLDNVTYDDVRRRWSRAWRQTANGEPNQFFTTGTNLVMVPPPSSAGTLSLRAHDIPPDLTTTTSTVTTLPYRFHDALAVMAAILLVNSDADNPAQAARLQGLFALWDMQDKELTDVIDARAVLTRTAREGG